MVICGHRGDPINCIENTITSFLYALDHGANSIETDICITKDKIPVLWHDWNPNNVISFMREAGFEENVTYMPKFPIYDFRKSINEISYKDFIKNYSYALKSNRQVVNKGSIPTLKLFTKLILTDNRIKTLFLDIKTPLENKYLAVEIIRNFKKYCKKYNVNKDLEIIIESFYPEILNILTEAFPDYKYALDITIPPGFIFRIKERYLAIKEAEKYNYDFAVAMRPTSITFFNWCVYKRIIKKQLKLNSKIKLVCATIDSKRELKWLMKKRVKYIQTNRPELLRKIINS